MEGKLIREFNAICKLQSYSITLNVDLMNLLTALKMFQVSVFLVDFVSLQSMINECCECVNPRQQHD